MIYALLKYVRMKTNITSPTIRYTQSKFCFAQKLMFLIGWYANESQIKHQIELEVSYCKCSKTSIRINFKWTHDLWLWLYGTCERRAIYKTLGRFESFKQSLEPFDFDSDLINLMFVLWHFYRKFQNHALFCGLFHMVFFVFICVYSIRSHCVCDDMLFDCLKKLNDTPAAQLMGSIYFNIVQVCTSFHRTTIQFSKFIISFIIICHCTEVLVNYLSVFVCHSAFELIFSESVSGSMHSWYSKRHSVSQSPRRFLTCCGISIMKWKQLKLLNELSNQWNQLPSNTFLSC